MQEEWFVTIEIIDMESSITMNIYGVDFEKYKPQILV